VTDLRGLNHAQLEAVTCTEGPVLVLAGAGSGKTRVITHRLGHLLQRGVPAGHVLCVTFTNKAAREMKERATQLVGRSLRGATLMTFHALGVRILRKFGAALGLNPSFTISDAQDQLGSFRRILRSMNFDDRRFDAKRVLSAVSALKNAGVTPRAFVESGGEIPEGVQVDFPDEEYVLATLEAFPKYDAALRAQNVVDFDDLLLLTVRLLREHPEVREQLADRWRYLMIDEYQDTNGAQLELIRLLSEPLRNVCVVGDDDQSIYGWRGADVTNILRFEHHFPGAQTITLDVNYRSTTPILEVANAVIAENVSRHPKHLRSARGDGRKVDVVALADEDEEAETVANAILGLQAEGVSMKDVAILYRSNVQSRAFEMALRHAHIPYKVVGGMDLFERKELKDALAYLRFLHNPQDEQSLRRIINVPPRGIGPTSVRTVDDFAREHGVTLVDVLDRVHEAPKLTGRAADAIAAFVDAVAEHRNMLSKRKASTVVKKLFECMKLEEMAFASSDDGVVAARRVDNIRDLVRQVERFEDRGRRAVRQRREASELEAAESWDSDDPEDFEDGAHSLAAFLSDLALAGFDDGRSKGPEPEEVVTLSTIHASKGLEWPHVFLVGAEEDLLPHRRVLEGQGTVDEERRLAYVAVTRAQRRLTVTWARTRRKYGQMVPRIPSRFLSAFPEDHVERKDQLVEERTEEQKEAIARSWRQKIREQLGMDSA
jgi:superfamily I DNA/RNA helicase